MRLGWLATLADFRKLAQPCGMNRITEIGHFRTDQAKSRTRNRAWSTSY